MNALVLVARVVLAAVFAVAAIAKLTDMAGTRRAVQAFRLPAATAIALPIVELATAALLLWPASAWWGALLAVALLILFEFTISSSLRRGRAPECHCFGQLRAAPISRRTLVRNALLAVPAILILVAG
jgi:uncharacterized membrane protein YphA (DoxX/SURF4 family)